MSVLKMWLVPGSRVNRQHNLFVSASKHLYVNANGVLRWQKKPIDRRTCGTKGIVTRLLLLDVDSGALYGELHDDNTVRTLSDFLLRAWHPKAGHFFRGPPDEMQVPSKVLDDLASTRDMAIICGPASVALGALPSGFAAGVHALKLYESTVTNYLPATGKELEVFQALAADLSFVASGSAYALQSEWDRVRQLPDSAKLAVDQVYGSGWWRSGQFSRAFPLSVARATDLAAFDSRSLVHMLRD